MSFDERKSAVFRWLVSTSQISLMRFLIKNLDLGDFPLGVEGKEGMSLSRKIVL